MEIIGTCTISSVIYSGTCSKFQSPLAQNRCSMLFNCLPGDMFSWGHGGHGRLGHGACDAAMRPTKISLSEVAEGSEAKFKFVAVGEAHSASIDSLGQVWCWGAGSFGRCGHGEETDFLVPQVVASMIGKSCSRVALGVCHSLALTLGNWTTRN